ncbi:RING/U-box superfamily protein [Rhynchospora pubera]|uniref:RING/U-box superfamily protein n=1 Tax=Rhynchospora pubera TaxID=906938 RepID=A0AAV8FNC4_9POAL|nr:RING/U-box superfamily protein [Rhynchospora pubera]KAJ4792571.1 RING/U-box superfamily protein [Rhynchospora pubera]KAJ4816397.1 RING/U-box superfamily protein [Rhynchospora pubera]
MHIVIMAGMLPGVEFARKRRLRQCSVSGLETHLGIKSMPRNSLSKELHGWSLGSIAREAKERLDEKFRSQRASVIKRHNSSDSLRPDNWKASSNEEGQRIASKLQREVYSSTKKGMRKLISWSKLGWKASDMPAECTVCLEEFKTGDVLVHLPCAHRFHSSCVVPWLESNSHCPVCRTAVCADT